MAMRVPQYEQRQTVGVRQPVGVVAPETGIGQAARGLANVGQMFDRWQADVDEADAKAADSRYSDMVRQTLYQDGTGYLYQQGGSALDQRKTVAETLQKGFDDTLAGLSPSAREMARAQLDSRRQSALTSIDRHAGSERVTYLNGQGEARINSAVNDAIVDPQYLDRSLAVARSEIKESAERNGWAPEVTALKEREAEGAIHGGIVARMANVDPVAALDYLNANRERMDAGKVAQFERVLVPEAKQFRGRGIGRDLAAQGIVGGAVPQSYYDSIRNAESGGRANADNPNSSAFGYYQAIDGTWNRYMTARPDLQLTPDGRGDLAQESRFIRAFTEDNANTLKRAGVGVTNGTLYAAHFLGAGGAVKALTQPMGAMMRDVVSPAVVRANEFLRDMTVADFVSWAERKGGNPDAAKPMGEFTAPSWSEVGVQPGPMEPEPQPLVDPVTQILGIEDPIERDAALREFQLYSGVQAKQAAAVQEAAQQAAFQMIEQGGSVNDLPIESKMAIGQSGMSSLRAHEKQMQPGAVEVETDPELYIELMDQQARDPMSFAASDPLEWLGRLSKSDFKQMVDARSKVIADGGKQNPDKAVTLSTVNTVSNDLLKAAGVDTKNKDGAQQAAKYRENLLRWAETTRLANDGVAPTQLEIREKAREMLTPIVFDPPGLGNRQAEPLVGIDFEGVTPDDVLNANIEIDGEPVDPVMVETFVQAFFDMFGRAPTPQEVIEGLAANPDAYIQTTP